jgi:hypothetical protein
MKVLGIVIGVIFFCLVIFVSVTPTGRRIMNNWGHSLQTADDQTRYKTLKQIEDTARSMIASYNSDTLTYRQYKDSEVSEERSWANQAKMRANKTATSYNDYILENSYLWKNGVPNDIKEKLPYIN